MRCSGAYARRSKAQVQKKDSGKKRAHGDWEMTLMELKMFTFTQEWGSARSDWRGYEGDRQGEKETYAAAQRPA